VSEKTIRALPIVLCLMLTIGVLAGCRAPDDASSDRRHTPVCGLESLPTLPGVRIVSVTAEDDGAPHCKVAGVIGTETNFELLLPDDWNGKFVMGGGGGFVGSVINTALVFEPLQAGYATVGTDTGHRGHPLDASWALHNLERIVSFGHQAVHRTAVTSQALISGYYGRASSADYFFGCSRGGGQALMEAQRYPGDFDGIVAGAPAFDWTRELGARNTWLNQIMFPDPNDLSVATVSPDEVQLIGTAVLERCDALDGLEDGILNNPLSCDFDVSSLGCAVGATEGCLSDLDVEAARRIYDDLYFNGERIFPGMPPGGELSPGGWSRWLTGGLDAGAGVESFQEGVVADAEFPAPVTPNAHWAFGNGVMKYLVMHDPDWDYTEYDFETFESDVAAVAPTLNATEADLTEFREQGGKLLMFTGWGDMALSPLGSIEYYENVLKHDPGASDDVRLMMIPGVDHCFGGVGPSWVNWLEEIDRWVETDVAPEQLPAYWLNEQGQPDGSRPVCAYPDQLEYDGTGDSRNAASFSCVSPDQAPG
jgi:feruloyl esterase